MEIGHVLQSQCTWFGTSPDPFSFVVEAKDYITAHQNTDSDRQMGKSQLQIHVCGAATAYFKVDENPEWSVRSVGNEAGRSFVQQLAKVCPVELKTKVSANTAPKLVDNWSLITNGQRFFRIHSSHNILRKFCVPKDHVRQFLHHAAVFGVSQCLYVVCTVRQIAYVIYFTFTDSEIDDYVSNLEKVFWL